jgi:hypothetical protein
MRQLDDGSVICQNMLLILIIEFYEVCHVSESDTRLNTDPDETHINSLRLLVEQY